MRVSCSPSAYPPHTCTFHCCHLVGQVSYALFRIDDKHSIHNRLCKASGKDVHNKLDNTLLSWRQLVMAAILYPIMMAATDMAFLYAQEKSIILASTLLSRAGHFMVLGHMSMLSLPPHLNSPVIFLVWRFCPLLRSWPHHFLSSLSSSSP